MSQISCYVQMEKEPLSSHTIFFRVETIKEKKRTIPSFPDSAPFLHPDYIILIKSDVRILDEGKQKLHLCLNDYLIVFEKDLYMTFYKHKFLEISLIFHKTATEFSIITS